MGCGEKVGYVGAMFTRVGCGFVGGKLRVRLWLLGVVCC